jgi:hypothetical protein
MAEYGVFDFEWIRGTTSPFMVEMVTGDPPAPIPLEDIRLSVYNANGKDLAFRITLVDNPGTLPGQVYEASPGIFVFTPTAAQTRLLTKTERGQPGKNRYEVEVRVDEAEDVYLLGVIAGIGGINDDEGS